MHRTTWPPRRLAALIFVYGLTSLAALGCDDSPDPDTVWGDESGAGVELEIVATASDLALADVVWDLSVENNSGQLVWTSRISSYQYGDGQGGITYVGPCDPAESPNVLKAWLVGVYDRALEHDLGGFNETHDGVGVDGLPVASQPEQWPILRSFPCPADQDVFVRLDVNLTAPTR